MNFLEETNDKWKSLNLERDQLKEELCKIKHEIFIIDEKIKDFTKNAESLGLVYDFDSWVEKGKERINPLLEISIDPNFILIFNEYGMLFKELITNGILPSEYIDTVLSSMELNPVVVSHIREWIEAYKNDDVRKLQILENEIQAVSPLFESNMRKNRQPMNDHRK